MKTAKKQQFSPSVIIALVIVMLSGVAAFGILFFGSNRVKQSADLKQCQTLAANQFKCYSAYLTSQTNTQGSLPTINELKKLGETDTYAKTECHQLVHVIGRAALDKYGTLASAYSKGDNYCWSGYYHGITEQAIGKIGAEGVKAKANEICADLARSKQYSFDHYNCAHGLGHGFLTVANSDLFEGLNACDLLHDSWERESCYGGAYMENVMIPTRGGTTKYLKPDQPMYPCTAVEYNYKKQCYLMQSSYVLQNNSYNFAQTFELCRNAADTDFVTTCYESIGRDASGSTVSNIDRTIEHCRKASEDRGIEHCMLGAVRDFISYHHSDKQAHDLCRAFGTKLLQRCEQELTTYYSAF